jgi:WD40 repeat protein
MSVRSVCKLYSSTHVLATGGRDSIINIYDRRYSKKQGALCPISSIACAHISSTALQKSARKDTRSVTAVEFQDEHNLYSCACADSAIKVWDLRYTYSRLNTSHMPKPKRMFCVPIDDVKSINRLAGFSDMKMDSTRLTLFANCTNSKIYQFDLHENTSSSSSKIQSYTGHRVGSFNVKIAISPHDQLLLTGSSDFYSYIYRINQPIIEPLKIEHHFEEVTAVAYHPTNPFSFITCSDDFQVRLWSLSLDHEITPLSNIPSVDNQSHNIITLLRHRQYGLTNRKSVLSSIFHTTCSPLRFVHKRKSSLSNLTSYNEKKVASRKRTVSENDENRRDHTDEKTSKRLCRSSEWIFGDSQLTLLKSLSTIDNRTSEQQTNYLLSKSDEYLSNNRRYSSDKQQTIDTLSTLVLSQ